MIKKKDRNLCKVYFKKLAFTHSEIATKSFLNCNINKIIRVIFLKYFKKKKKTRINFNIFYNTIHFLFVLLFVYCNCIAFVLGILPLVQSNRTCV